MEEENINPVVFGISTGPWLLVFAVDLQYGFCLRVFFKLFLAEDARYRRLGKTAK
jgi:hypothetical protein